MSRRTGVELKDTGVRDENGIEPIPSFSSPAKPAFQQNGITHNITDSADDSMDIAESKAYMWCDVSQHVQSLISYFHRYNTRTFRISQKYTKRQDQPSATCNFSYQNASQLITQKVHAWICGTNVFTLTEPK